MENNTKIVKCDNFKIVKCDNFKIEYYIKDAVGNVSFGQNKYWEPHIIKFVKLYNSNFPVENIIDVGANLGSHTIFFSNEIKNNGLVFAFEPQVQNFELLKKNINNNHIRNVLIFNNACDDENTKISIPYVALDDDINMGDFTPNTTHYKAINYNEITSLTLDSMVFPPISIIKINVQGWEIKVLEGSKELIKNNKPVIIIGLEEYQLNKVNKNCNDLIECIKNLEYEIFHLEYIYPSDHICIHKDNLDGFKEKFGEYIINNNIKLDYETYFEN